jgi:signal transduction histidine kinase
MATAERPLRREELVTLAILGVPTFAFALAITTVSTYLPVLASSFAPSTVVIGALIGGEGLMVLGLPVLVGSWSDRLSTPIGRRLPFVLGAAPVVALALAFLGFVSSTGVAAFGLAIFFAAYFVAYEPYRALYPDLVDDEAAPRAPRRWRAASPPSRRSAPAACSSPWAIRCRSSSAPRSSPSASGRSAGWSSGGACPARSAARRAGQQGRREAGRDHAPHQPRAHAPRRRAARALTALMRRVDPLAPGERLPQEGTTSEVSDLAAAFNDMLDRLEGERRDSARRAMGAQERERRRLAAELHDEIGQSLTALLLQLRRGAVDGNNAGPLLGQGARATERILDDVRAVARRLRPEALDDLGLASALNSLCEQLSPAACASCAASTARRPALSTPNPSSSSTAWPRRASPKSSATPRPRAPRSTSIAREPRSSSA